MKGTVTYKGTTKPLAYDSSLTVVRRAEDGKPLVEWHSAIVHPDLKDGDTLVTGESGTPPVKALDRDGGELTEEEYPSLGSRPRRAAREVRREGRRQGGRRTPGGPG